MRYKDLERINEYNSCCYNKIRIQKYNDVMNNYLLSDDNDDVIFNIEGPRYSKYHMMVLNLTELINLIIYRDEYIYITNLEVLKDEELEDYVIQRQLNFSFVNTSDYYINHIKEVDEGFYKSKLYMRVMQNGSGIVKNKKIKVVDLNDILYTAENSDCNIISLMIDRINEKLERNLYTPLTSVEEYMVKNMIRDELADRLAWSCL